MEFSLVGVLICVSMVLISLRIGGIVAGLIASLAFGATSAISLPALGGSSPLIFTILQIILICSVALKRSFIRDLCAVLVQQPIAWIVLVFIIYVLAGSFILPRLFLGQTTAFVPIRLESRIAEVPLSPVSGNLTQSLYFLLNALTFFAISVLLLRNSCLKHIRNGFFLWAILLIATGLADLGGKLAGAGDILEPLRTASYSMLTDVEQAGFFRIAGAYAEASAFGAATVCVLAFTFTYWRATQEFIALVLSILLLVLLLLSTSSTAYVGAAIVSIPLFFSILKSSANGRISRQDIFLLSCGIATLVVVIAINLYDEKVLEPFWDLLNTMIFNKASSASGQERAYWNVRSLDSFYDTGGLGIGLGSSRASSWVVAVVSQFGVIGAILIAAMLFQIVSKRWLSVPENSEPDTYAIAASLRSAALGALVTVSVSGGSADPGVLFFIALGVSSSFKQNARRTITDHFADFSEERRLAPG